MKNKFTVKAENALKAAKEIAESAGHTYIGSEHLLLGLLDEKGCVASKLMDGRSIKRDRIFKKMLEFTGNGERTLLTPEDMTPKTRKIVTASAKLCDSLGFKSIGTEHLLYSILDDGDNTATRILEDSGTSIKELKSDISIYFGAIEDYKTNSTPNDKRKTSQKKNISTLLQYGIDLTERAATELSEPVVGREKEISRIIRTLARKTKNNPLLVGEPGVGKTAIVEGLAKEIAEHRVPDVLLDKQIISLDLSSMIAGAKYRGEFEERLKNIINEAKKDNEIILFIDEIHTIIGAGSAEGAMDAANILKPVLARGEIRVIGATTTAEYSKHIEKDAALERRFQPIIIEEPSKEEAIFMLKGLKERYEKHHAIVISDEAVKAAVELSDIYIPDRYLPDKAIDLLDEAASALHIETVTEPNRIEAIRKELVRTRSSKETSLFTKDIESAERYKKAEIKEEEKLLNETAKWEKQKSKAFPVLNDHHIRNTISEMTGIKLSELSTKDEADLSDLASKLKHRIFGQDRACEAVASAIIRSRTGLRDTNRPIGSFIFSGSTGVGKTALAEALTEELYGSKKHMLRFDMSEYSERHSIAKLIGSPPGYVGYEEGGRLTEKVRHNRTGIILFDEIDKAHSDIYGILLQILEDGCLSDSRGRIADFNNYIIIITTNAGGTGTKIGFSEENQTSRNKLSSCFKPELLNRIDEVIAFDKLDHDALKKISKTEIDRIVSKVEKAGYKLDVNEEIEELFSNTFETAAFGARAIIRRIKRDLENRISHLIITKQVCAGDRITVCLTDNKLSFEVTSPIPNS